MLTSEYHHVNSGRIAVYLAYTEMTSLSSVQRNNTGPVFFDILALEHFVNTANNMCLYVLLLELVSIG